MTIPGDPEDRWWCEIAPLNPALVDKVRPALIDFMAFSPGLEPSVLGTGFVIAGGSEYALVITARHVLDGVAQVQRPWSKQAPSAIFIPAGVNTPSLDPMHLKAVWMGSGHADMMNVVHVNLNDSLDIACCLIVPQDSDSLFSPVSIPLDIAVPIVGERVEMYSLDNRLVEELNPPEACGKGHVIKIARNVSVRLGVVTAVYPQGFRQFRWPCFTTSIPAEPGMSGGLIALPRDGKITAACGIVSANSPISDACDWHQCGESIVASAWPALALRIPDTIPSTTDSPSRSLYEFMRAGHMDAAIGGIDRVSVNEKANGDATISLRDVDTP